MSDQVLITIITVGATLYGSSLLFFVNYIMKRRNDIEKRIGITLDTIKTEVSEIKTRISIIEIKMKYERSKPNEES